MRDGIETCIGVDVGGTRMRVASVDREGGLIDRVIEPVSRDRQGFVTQLLRLIDTLRDDRTAGVGVGIPGRVDGSSGLIKSAGYLDIAGLDLPGLIARKAGLPARIENDATMALVAEGHMRGGGAEGLILMVTVGTGIGGAILENGAPWYGGGGSGQFGHIVVAEDGPICNCGRKGCVETFSSGTALGQMIAAAGLPDGLRVEDLFVRAESGDAAAESVLHRWSQPLQRALETLVAVCDPRLIVIGGGLGNEMVRALDRTPRRSKWFDLPIEPARLGDDAGVIGAALRGFDLRSPTERGLAG